MKPGLLPTLLWVGAAGLWLGWYRSSAPPRGQIVTLTASAAAFQPCTAGAPRTADSTARPAGLSALPRQCVNLNAASLDLLLTLPGIGPALARRIVDYRAQQGPFRDAADVLKVNGIGPVKLARIRERVCF